MPATRKTAAVRKTSGSRKPAVTRKPAKKQPPRKNTKNINKKPVSRKPAQGQAATPAEFATLTYCCVAVLMFILICTGDSSDFSRIVNNLFRGLFGYFSILVPPTLIWMGVRRFRGIEKQGKRGVDEIPPLTVLFGVLTVSEAFAAEDVLAGHMDGYLNFIRYAFEGKLGGGAAGALLGYPGYKITPWLTLVIVLMIVCVMFNLKGYFSLRTVGEKVSKGTQSVKAGAAKLKTEFAERRRLYDEDRHASWEDDEDGDVVIPELDSPIKMETKELKSAGNVMHIERAAEKKKAREPYTGGQKTTRHTGGSVYGERIEVARDTVKKPEVKPDVKPSPKAAEPVKPVREEHKPVEKPVKEPVYQPIYEPEDDDDYDIPEYVPLGKKPEKSVETEKANEAKPLHKEPQEPKPSFFGDSVNKGPTGKQNTEQGRTVQEARADIKATDTIKDLDRNNPEVSKPYSFPALDLLETGAGNATVDSGASDRERGQMLVKILDDFNIPVKLTGISHGPAVTRLEILPDPGIKVSRITQYSDDIQMGLAVKSVRIEAPIPGRRAVGVEIPNPKREIVNLRDVLESQEARTSNKKLLVALGKDNGGNYVLADLAGMPHVLIAGQTGSGKSICINAIIISLLYRYTPDEVRLIMVDPKMVELNVYNTIPHLLVPVVTDPQKAAGALDWAVMEMTRRYKVFKDNGTKNIENYNAHLPEGEKPMSRIVIIVDELADLMMTAKHDVEESINRLAQLARAAGMHLVIATQRPSVNVITGLIKANIPTRIAFTVASGVDSNTILDCYGAEKLLGKGDMLYAAADSNKPMRMQGAWVSEDEVQRVVDHISDQETVVFDEEILEHLENSGATESEKKEKIEKEASEETDPLLEDALRAVVEAGQASISMLQRKLKVGYPRAGKLIDMMEQRGFISKGEGSKAREVIISREQMERLFSGGGGEENDEV